MALSPSELSEVVHEFRSTVVLLRPPGSMGNGFIVASSGSQRLIMTCSHVINRCVAAGVATFPAYLSGLAEKVDATIIYHNVETDIALLRVSLGDLLPEIPVTFCDLPLSIGMDIVMLGFFMMGNSAFIKEPGTSPGKVIAGLWRHNAVCPGGPRDRVMGSYTSRAGNSGSPVFHVTRELCEVIGMHASTSFPVRNFISVSTIKTTLKHWLGIGPAEDKTITELLDTIILQE